MPDALDESRISGWPRGLLGMLLLISAVELSILHHRLTFLTFDTLTWFLTEQAVAREAQTSQILCFGDSQVKFGLIPQAIEREAKLTAFNLAVNAGPAPASYFALRKVLDGGARPLALVVDFAPHVLMKPPQLGPSFWTELLGWPELMELAWASRSFGFGLRHTMAWVFPSIRYRPQIRTGIVNALRAHAEACDYDVSLMSRNIRRNQGAIVMPHVPRMAPIVTGKERGFFPPYWRCHPLNERYVRRFLELADRNGIPVFWLIPPFVESIQAHREALGHDAALLRFIRAVHAEFPRVTVLDVRRSGYDYSVFFDGTHHLDCQGALSLSVDVAKVVSQSLRGNQIGRWVELPPYRFQPALESLEDLEESRVAISAAGSIRK